MSADCQVDFYVLADGAPSAGHLACRLCLKAWEDQHRVAVLAPSEEEARLLDELLWEYPAGRFVPHERGHADAEAPVAICSPSEPIPPGRDVIVNLTPVAVPDPGRVRRLLEHLPADHALRESSRIKFREYRRLGLEPNHHQIQAF